MGFKSCNDFMPFKSMKLDMSNNVTIRYAKHIVFFCNTVRRNAILNTQNHTNVMNF